jgi:hypothetical protein
MNNTPASFSAVGDIAAAIARVLADSKKNAAVQGWVV